MGVGNAGVLEWKRGNTWYRHQGRSVGQLSCPFLGGTGDRDLGLWAGMSLGCPPSCYRCYQFL